MPSCHDQPVRPRATPHRAWARAGGRSGALPSRLRWRGRRWCRCLSIAANPWPGSYANAHVAAEILTQELGLEVEIVEIDENAQWAGLDDGSIDAVLEVWPSGMRTTTRPTSTSSGRSRTAVRSARSDRSAGSCRATCSPPLRADDVGGAARLRGPVRDDGDRTSGRFLAADPSFVQFDEAIIANLGLDLTSCSPAPRRRSSRPSRPPSARRAGALLLLHAALAARALRPDDGRAARVERGVRGAAGGAADCGYPEDVLFKAFHCGLAERLPEATRC
jgi:glycine betaine/proline transport system substrate-binding protein